MQQRAGLPVVGDEAFRFAGDAREGIREAERVNDFHRTRSELQSGAEFTQHARALENLNLVAALLQGPRAREPADPCPDDADLQPPRHKLVLDL